MPILSLSTIEKLCHAQQTYVRGQRYADQGRVQFHASVPDGAFKNVFTATVRGTGVSNYTTTVTLTDNNQTVDAVHCDCLAFSTYQGICKHLVATLLQLNNQFGRAPSPLPMHGSTIRFPAPEKTDFAGKLLLRSFSAQAAQAVEATLAAGDIRLVCTLNSYYDTLYATFSLGRERLYVLKNLRAFLASLEAGETVAYGKTFSFVHNIAQFDAPSRALIALLQAQLSSAVQPSSYESMLPYNMAPRALLLLPKQLDDFMELFLDSDLSCALPRAQPMLHVVDATPRLRLRLGSTEKGGYCLGLDAPVEVLFGLQHLYLPMEDTLYRCDVAFSTETVGLWHALARAAQSKQITFSAKDMPSFCATVLPILRKHFAVEEACDLQTVTPPPLTAALYLDTNEAGDVVGKLEFSYDTKKYAAFAPAYSRSGLDIAKETLLEQMVQRYFDEITPDGTAILHSAHEEKLLQLADTGVASLSPLCEIYASDSFKAIKIRPPLTANIGVRLTSGLLHLEMDLGTFDPAELSHVLDAYKRSKRYYRLRDGTFLNLQDSALSELSQLTQALNLSSKQLAQTDIAVSSYYTLYLNQLLKKSQDITYDRDKKFKEIVRNLHNVQESDFIVPPALKSVLRSYQKDGYRWICTLGCYGFGGILADDMGLGKTLQVLAVLLAQKAQQNAEQSAEQSAQANLSPAQHTAPTNQAATASPPHAPSLVVCPSSLVLNWHSEATRFAPQLRILAVQGTAEARAQALTTGAQADLIITSYDSLKRDIAQYESLEFLYVVADEAQYMKNHNTQNARAVKALHSQYRLALTGTPIENSLAELWSIFDFLMPGYLYGYTQFRSRFEQPIVREGDTEASKRLQAMVAPFVLRRMKKDVLHELPDKTETVLCAPLTEKQHKLYAATALKAQEMLEKSNAPANQSKFQLLAMLTRMRQLCCDPSLVYENSAAGSAKLELCMELIETCIQSGHRLLLFSQFTSMLDIFTARLEAANIDYYLLTGATKPADRLNLVNAFNAGQTPVFLISLKAGGTGLNLTGADTVIHYDPWWNVSAQNQASDRAYRIGQTKKVQVYKLIAKDTIEERILELQQKKSDLADLVMTENDSAFARLTKDELASLFAVE